LSQDFVGDYQLFSNLDSTPYSDLTQVSEYWYQQNLYDNQLWFKIGRQDANANFALVDLGGDFVNSSFGLIPTVLLPTFPSPALGTAGFWEINENVQLGGGVYDGAPAGVQSGFNTLGEFGYMSLVQLQIKSQFGVEGQLPSTVRLGAWQHSNQWDEITTSDDPRVFSQNYGIWASFDQLLWKETDEEGDEQGLGAFGQFGWAPGNRNPVQEYYGAGLVYRGLLPERNRDLVGLGMANVLFSPEQRAVGGETFETAIEFFYKWYVGDYISLQPDFQYIVNPGGVHRDAVVPGMRFEVVF
ncbi:MAG TPA: carbohydrate porin, partial [Pirellulaceae bacterium]|nr:carbohydrate porin [Pirellulaceae bacterium]